MVTEAEVFDQVGDRAGGRGLPVPQSAVLTLVRQALPDAGARLVDLKRALPVQVSPSVIFWFANDKEKQDLRRPSCQPSTSSPRTRLKQDVRARKALKSHAVQPRFTGEKLRLREGTGVPRCSARSRARSRIQAAPRTPETVSSPTYRTASQESPKHYCSPQRLLIF